MAVKLRITWRRSGIGHKKEHLRTVRALGLRRLWHTVVREDTPTIRGMVHQVRHLVSVEEVPGGDEGTAREAVGRGGKAGGAPEGVPGGGDT